MSEPRFEWQMTKTYVQDAHKPWAGYIQGDYYVGSPVEQRLRQLPLTPAYKPGRPLAVKPYEPGYRPVGTESEAPPLYNHGYDYPAEGYEPIPGSVPKGVGMNQLPKYFGTVDLDTAFRPTAWASGADWLSDFGAPANEQFRAADSTTLVGPSKAARVFSDFARVVRTTPKRINPRGVNSVLRRRLRGANVPGSNGVNVRTTNGALNFNAVDGKPETVLGIREMVPRPDRPFWGADMLEMHGPAFYGSPKKVYGVTKVIDTIVQDYPWEPMPDAGEDVAYNPQDELHPFGVYQPTISKVVGRKPLSPYWG